MKKILFDETLRAKFGSIDQAMELRDAEGNLIASVFPPGYFYLAAVSDEELARRARSTEKRYTTAEVLKHLESL